MVTARCHLHFRADSLDFGRPSLGLGMSAQAGLYRCMFQKPKEAKLIARCLALRLTVSCCEYLGLSGFSTSLKRISLFSLDLSYHFCRRAGSYVPDRAVGCVSLPRPVHKGAFRWPITFLIPLKYSESNISNYVLALGKKKIWELFPMSFYLGKRKYFGGIWANLFL